jgi:hypothetical protein
VDLHAELAETRAWIRELRTTLNLPTYPGWAWEHRHNLEGRLGFLTHHEANLVDRITAADQATDQLVQAALCSGDPVVFVVAYVVAGTITSRPRARYRIRKDRSGWYTLDTRTGRIPQTGLVHAGALHLRDRLNRSA